MFRRKKNDPVEAPSSKAKPESPPHSEAAAESAVARRPEGEEAMDTLDCVLRSLGDLSFDLQDLDAEAIRQLFDAWARHVLVGAPRPGREEDEEAPRGVREWSALRQFVSDHRRKEADYVDVSLRDLRQVVWMFIQGLGRAVVADRDDEGEVSEQLGRLRGAIDGSDTGELKRVALESISSIEGMLEDRKQRQQAHVAALAERISEMSVELTDAREKMVIDPLTEVGNRASLDDYLARLVELGHALGSAACLFMIDVDHFKWVNDKFGHPAGDEVLKQVARTLSESFHRKGDLVCRFGGDEFAAVVQEGALDVARTLAERMLFGVRDLDVRTDTETVRVSVSIGAARLLPGDDVQAWVARADQALYSAKEMGRDRAVVDPSGGAATGPSRRE